MEFGRKLTTSHPDDHRILATPSVTWSTWMCRFQDPVVVSRRLFAAFWEMYVNKRRIRGPRGHAHMHRSGEALTVTHRVARRAMRNAPC